MRINIKEIAKRADVSIATVSRVFNNSGYVKPETREKIEKIIEETGYRPNILARELANKKTNLIGILAHSITGEGIPLSIEGISRCFSEMGYSLMIACTKGIFEEEERYFNIFHQKQVEGIILFTNQLKKEHDEMIKKLPFPVVVVLQDVSDKNLPCVIFDDFNFAYKAAEELIHSGHKDIAYIGGPTQSDNAKRRKNGFVSAMLDHNLEINSSLILEGDFSLQSGYEKMQQIFDLDQKVSSVLVANDGMAIGVINCIFDNGFTVPDDISVMGMDDTALATAARPNLSTIHYSYSDLGEEAGSLLLDLINKKKIRFNKIVIPFQLKKRNTVKKI